MIDELAEFILNSDEGSNLDEFFQGRPGAEIQECLKVISYWANLAGFLHVLDESDPEN